MDVTIVYSYLMANVVLNCSVGHTDSSINSKPSISWDFSRKRKDNALVDGLKVNPQVSGSKYNIAGNVSKGDYNLLIGNVSYEDEGLYRCWEVNNSESSLAKTEYELRIRVNPSNPNILNSSSVGIITGREGIPLNVTCTVISGVPEETMFWYDGATELLSDGPTRLTFSFVPYSADHGKNLTCVVLYEFLGEPLTKSVMLDIQYKPLVQFRGINVAVVENDLLSLCCIADSNPPTSETVIAKDGTHLKVCNSSVCKYTFRPTRSQNGTYTCSAKNEVDNSFAKTSVVVQYPPNVTVSNKNNILQCVPNGVPDNYSFYHWKHYSELGLLIRTMKSSKYHKIENNSVKKYKLSGFYECAVSNGIYDAEGKQFQTGKLLVKLQDLPEVMSTTKLTQYGKYGGVGQIDLHVYSYPELKRINVFKNGTDLVGCDLRIDNGTILKELGFNKLLKIKCSTVSLKLSKLYKDDFTTYQFNIWNSLGYRKFEAKLTSREIPEEPSVSSLYSSKDGLTLIFNSSYNGGLQQTFTVEYRRQNQQKWTKSDVINDTFQHTYQYHIDRPITDTIYHVRVYASNEVGKSKFSEKISVRTIGRIKTSLSPYAVIVGSGTLIALTVILTLVAYRKGIQNCVKCTTRITDASHELQTYQRGVSVENQVYQSRNGPEHAGIQGEHGAHQHHDSSVENQMYQFQDGILQYERNMEQVLLHHNGCIVRFDNIGQDNSQQGQAALNYAELVLNESSDIELENRSRDATIYSEIDHSAMTPRQLDESIDGDNHSTSCDDDDDDDFMSLDGIIDYRKDLQLDYTTK